MKILNTAQFGKKVLPGGNLHLADILYVATNAAFVLALILLIFVWQLPILALILALASKWRIVALRPRYWAMNVRSNLIDLIFIVSATALAAHPAAGLTAQIIWLTLLSLWLLVIKRLTNQMGILIQATTAQVVGLCALLSFSALIPINQLFFLSVTVGAWIISYVSARHMLVNYSEEPKAEFLALLWGLVGAEITWVMSHWLQTYELVPGFAVPQVALVLLLLSFAAQRVYGLQKKIQSNQDPDMKKKETRAALTHAYGALGFSGVFIVIILLTADWTISI